MFSGRGVGHPDHGTESPLTSPRRQSAVTVEMLFLVSPSLLRLLKPVPHRLLVL
jgi:hypothetical protein